MSTSNRNTALTKKSVPIDYTKKGFSEIKEDLKSYIKRNYPDTYQDFSKSSFGSMMLDLVSYIGDQLHYYIDHNANESNPAYAKEAENVFGWLNALGTRPEIDFAAVGHLLLYVPWPADAFGVGLDLDYAMRMQAFTVYGSQGGNTYTQSQDVPITSQTAETIGHKTTADGSKIEYFLLKVRVPVISGQINRLTVEVTGENDFQTIEVPGALEILEVVDAEGNTYIEADNLTADVALQSLNDSSGATDPNDTTRMIRKPIPRRFVKRRTLDRTYITFGHGSDANETTNSFVDPTKVATKFAAKKAITTPRQDPYNMVNSGGLGIAPKDTTITITYRSNANTNSNAAVGTINQVLDPILSFQNEQLLDPVKVAYIRENMQAYNEEPINGFVSVPNTEELKHRYLGNYSAQGRAVTKQDYVSAVYSMPATYGSVKRAAVVRDTNDFRRNLNLYLISEGSSGKMEAPSLLLKQNVKTWVDSMRMISDSVDIFDAKILNLALDIKVKIAANSNPQTMLTSIKNKLYEELMTIPPDIGQNFSISEVYRILRQVPEVASIAPGDGVVVRNLVGAGKYSEYSYDIPGNLSEDQETIYIPDNTIWEIKYLDDITGTIVR
jgi:hypothetical protein